MALEYFAPATRRWFESAFGEPTPAQEQAWPAIARGEHVLVCAPTGSGKTLAAFLWALDRLVAEQQPRDGRARRLREPAEGPRLRHRAQPAGAPEGDRRRGDPRRDPHRRHPPARARRDGPQPAGHPRHDPRVPVPDPHLPGAQMLDGRRGGDRRRDPRRGRLQARLAPGADARAPRARSARGAAAGAAARPARRRLSSGSA